jgi:prepilin peptidase CpaA
LPRPSRLDGYSTTAAKSRIYLFVEIIYCADCFLRSARINFDISQNSTVSMPLASVLFALWSALVAWADCRDRRVANWLVAAGGVAAIACAALRASPLGVSVMQAAFGFVIGLAVLLPFFLLGAMGAADVKVFAVLGAWCGAAALPGIWVAASLAAGMHALALIVAARVSSRDAPAWSPLPNGQPTFAIGERRASPYAAMLVGAALLHWFSNVLWGGA